jgi:PAS domain-containing protein
MAVKGEEHHEELVRGMAEQLKKILDNSPQAIYIYMDDNHKTCNKNFATMLGYKSVRAWEKIDAPLADVVEAHQQKVIDAYVKASESLEAGSVRVTMKNVTTGELIKTSMIMAPVVYEGHVMTMHFISKI